MVFDKELQFIRDKIRYADNFKEFVIEIIGLKCEKFHEEWIESFENGRYNLLLAPRGHGKSLMVSSYIIWNIIKDPNIKIIIVTINQDRANSIMRFIQKNLEGNHKLIDIFGEQRSNVLWSRDSLLVRDAKTRDNPTLKVLGITGGMIGGHFDIIVLDDITDKENSRTEHRRRFLVSQFNNEIMPMLNPKPYGKVIIIGTKWHQADIYHYIGEEVPDYAFNKYQAITYETEKLKDFVYNLGPKLSGTEFKETIREFIDKLPEDEKPKILWDWLFPYEELADIRRRYGNVAFMMQYQNEFISPEDAPIRWEWIESARDNYEIPKLPFDTYMGVDLASKGEESDYFTISIIGIKEGLVYILDGLRDKLSLHGQTEEIRRMYLKWNPVKIGIEQAGPQKIAVDHIISKLVGYPIIPVKTSSTNDRPQRVGNLSVQFEMERIFINPKLAELIDELASYPRGATDDLIDSLSFAVQVSQVQEDIKASINWDDAAEMISAKKSVKSVKSVERSFDFYKV